MNAPPLSPLSGLTRGFRVAAVLCGIFSAFVGALAGGEAMGLMLGQSSSADRFASRGVQGAGADAAQAQQAAVGAALEALRQKQVDILSQMETSRTLILGLLALGAALCFLASMRLLRPVGLPREGARKTLVFGAVLAALCRTADGAQTAVVTRHCAPELEALLSAVLGPEGMGDSSALLQPMARDFAMIGPIAMTVFVAGAFAVFAQTFRSERLRRRLAELDAQES